jgi:nucleotide-binding universal stress UspA family protein
MFSNILVAVDGSASSVSALDMAIEIAKNFGAKLHLLHVVREMQLPKELGRVAELGKIQKQRESALKQVGEEILNQAKRTAQSKGIKSVEDSIGSGDPANSIDGYAASKPIDLIVLGSRGLGQVEGMLLGSVSRKVSNLAKVPCLIAK